MKILIVDDEKDIRELIKIYLQSENYTIVEASDGEEALSKVDSSVDLILLDVMMPKIDGVKTCIEIRKNFNTPIIFLSAKGEDHDKLTGFTVGADDYIVKPFNPIDLIARVKANIRRYRSYNDIKQVVTDEIVVENISLNKVSHVVKKSGIEIKLTKKEFDILALFFRNRARVFSLDEIYELVWKENSILNAESTVSVHIRNLRDKIEENISEPKIIKTIWGVGYRVD